MNFPALITISLLYLLLCCTAASAASPTSSLELAVTLYNPDWELRENATGLRLSGSWMLGTHIQIRGTYNSFNTDPANTDGPIRGIRGLPFGNWREAGLAYVTGLGDDSSVEIEVSYQGLELYNKIESGSAIAASINHRFSDRFSGALRLSYFDLQTDDVRLTGTLYTELSDRIDLVTRIDDTSEFDFTWYEVGLRFRF